MQTRDGRSSRAAAGSYPVRPALLRARGETVAAAGAALGSEEAQVDMGLVASSRSRVLQPLLRARDETAAAVGVYFGGEEAQGDRPAVTLVLLRAATPTTAR